MRIHEHPKGEEKKKKKKKKQGLYFWAEFLVHLHKEGETALVNAKAGRTRNEVVAHLIAGGGE